MKPIGIKKNIAVIDFETTGFSPYNDEITEVALSLFDGMTGEVIGVFNHLVKIKADKVPDKITEITGIDKQMTENYGIDLSVISDYLNDVLSDAVVVAHNYQFEAHWLDVVFGIKPQLFYDTLAIDRLERPHEASHKLGDICEREGISLIGAHRALNDVNATAELLSSQLRKEDNRKKYINVITTVKGKENYRPDNVQREEPI